MPPHSAGKRPNKGILESLPAPHTFPLSRLAAVDSQTAKLVRNTEQFLAGRPANNVLLTGSRGTGKSSLVKALLHEYGASGLRLDRKMLRPCPLHQMARMRSVAPNVRNCQSHIPFYPLCYLWLL